MQPAEPRATVWILPAAVCAASLPSLLAFNVAPSPTFLNQAMALVAWGLFVVAGAVATASGVDARLATRQALRIPFAVLACMGLLALASWLWGALPSTLSLSALGTLAAAAVLAAAGARVGATGSSAGQRVFEAFCLAWVVAGLLNAGVGAVQVFAPGWADGEWIARSAIPGRAVGNLRQPNHLCTLLLWAMVATVALRAGGRLRPVPATSILLVLTLGLVLTASRTAVLGIGLMAVWGLIDRRLPGRLRLTLLAGPLAYALCWAGMAAWADWSRATFGGQQRLAEADLSASRFRIWSDTWQLIQAHPWAGVGFGEFNFAWSLSALPNRPPAFFDHTHNLFLQWAVELGLPVAIGSSVLLGAGLWIIARGARQAADEEAAVSLRAVLMLLLITALHSQLEYPLWYAYFLLPTAWLLGHGLAAAARAQGVDSSLASEVGASARVSWAMAAAGLAVALGGVWAVSDYSRVAVIFDAHSAVPLSERIERGRRSWLFGHHADYAAATLAAQPEREMAAFARAAHYLLDTRLMMAWADAWARSGDGPRAQHLAERLREFRNPASQAFFEACQDPASMGSAAALPYQCARGDAGTTLSWADFAQPSDSVNRP